MWCSVFLVSLHCCFWCLFVCLFVFQAKLSQLSEPVLIQQVLQSSNHLSNPCSELALVILCPSCTGEPRTRRNTPGVAS
uniref:Secreted protein n=1 Tax=Anas zonorhyncha TaxID=75864 RepID=A0A8B9U0X8_9AVES